MTNEFLARYRKSGPGRMTLIVVHHDDLIGPDLRWPLRIAKLENTDITLLVCVNDELRKDPKEIKLMESAGQPADENGIAERMRSALDSYLGPQQWTCEQQKPHSEEEQAAADSQAGIPHVKLQLLASDHVVEHVRKMNRQLRVDPLLFVGRGDADIRKKWLDILESLMKSLTCQAALVVPGERREDGELLVAAGRRQNGRIAIDLAGVLAVRAERKLTAVYVEPEIGSDAEAVGNMILNNRLRNRDIPSETKRRVVIQNDPAKGIIETCSEESYEVLFFGATRLGAAGKLVPGGIPGRILKSRPDVTLIAVRNQLPLGNRLQREIELLLRRRVPQLLREERIDLVERVQSSSQWNFDFILLIMLSTFIATLGLLDNSTAVIIGAMLVAPLMTPLLGFGLALGQGNARLAKITLKALSMGFVVAFGIALTIGLMSKDFYSLTDQMRSRDWPQMLDLVIAFLSGIAAAYASGRKQLIAALPGVAMAAALLPPVATSALAITVGNYYIALGAMLLFLVNIVAITIGAAGCFWAVGIREFTTDITQVRLIKYSFLVAAAAVVIALCLVPPLHAPPREMVKEVISMLPNDLRVRQIFVRRTNMGKNVSLQINLGGPQLPEPELEKKVREVVNRHMGEDMGVRLTLRYETLVN